MNSTIPMSQTSKYTPYTFYTLERDLPDITQEGALDQQIDTDTRSQDDPASGYAPYLSRNIQTPQEECLSLL